MPVDMWMRPVVKNFGIAMENVLQKHDEKKGKSGWKGRRTDQSHYAIRKLLDEICEHQADHQKVAELSVDIANHAMMLWDNMCDDLRKDILKSFKLSVSGSSDDELSGA